MLLQQPEQTNTTAKTVPSKEDLCLLRTDSLTASFLTFFLIFWSLFALCENCRPNSPYFETHRLCLLTSVQPLR